MESKNGWPKIIQGLRSLRPLPDDYWMVVKCYKNGRLAYKFWPAAFQALFYAEFTLTLYAPSDTRYSNPVKNSERLATFQYKHECKDISAGFASSDWGDAVSDWTIRFWKYDSLVLCLTVFVKSLGMSLKSNNSITSWKLQNDSERIFSVRIGKKNTLVICHLC